MGGLPAIAFESLQRMILPDTPPGLASPSASSFSSRSSPSTEQAAWGPRTPSSFIPMSHCEKLPAAERAADSTPEMNISRPESGNPSLSRQQLPSLSSLFGPPAPIRPVNSPHLDRHNPPYLSHPASDRPRLTPASGNPASHLSLSSPTASSSQPRSLYDVKYDAERQQYPPTSYPLAGSRSPPAYRDLNQTRADYRSDAPEGSRWSMHHDTSRQEYSLGSRESPYRSPGSRFRHHVPGSSTDSLHDFSEQRPRQVSGSSSNPPPTPASTITSSDLTISVSKDGLGPKIWTGTHFLPRFVRAADVPGEGMCYFYDDGTHCKTVIDGEAVNAHWGVTKAGKPRKRLAIACMTCREKKIKCDPDYPRCVQCEKFGRICKFKNAPRGGNNTSPSTPPAELDDGRAANDGISKSGDYRQSMSDARSTTSPQPGACHSSPEEGSSKRLKLGPQAYALAGEPSVSRTSTLDRPKWQLAEQRPVPEMPRIPDDVLNRAWQTDPYVSDPHSIIAVLTKFFAAVDSTMMIQFLPEEGVLNWVSNYAHRKTPEDFMLLYSILAVGVALSDGSEQIANEYAQVAHYAQKMLETPCLQLVQSRILLAVYYVATCRHKEADQLISSAVATSSFLQLHLELDHSREASMKVFPFGMNRNGYAESRRRTFWALFMLERLSGYFPDRPVMINAEDIFTRLPADHASFERLVDIRAPMFDPYVSSFGQVAEQSVDIAGFQVELVHIWAETQAFNQRMALRPALADAEAQKLQGLTERAERWYAALPARLKFGGANLESAAFSGTIGSFLSIHMLYHHVLIKLNRHRGRLDQISVEARGEHAAKCRRHASSIVEMLDSLDRILRMRPTLLKTPPAVMAMAVTEAVDVLSASGSMTAMPDLIDILRVAKSALERMTHVWRASAHSLLMIEQRLQNLQHIHRQGSRPSTPHDSYRLLPSNENKDRMGNHWQINDPIERSFPVEMDMLYFKRGWEI